MSANLEQNVVEDSRPEQHQNNSVNHSETSNYCHDQLAVPLRKISERHLCFCLIKIQSQNDLLQQHYLRTRAATLLTVLLVLSHGERLIHTTSRLISFNKFLISLSKSEIVSSSLVFFACLTILSRDYQTLSFDGP